MNFRWTFSSLDVSKCNLEYFSVKSKERKIQKVHKPGSLVATVLKNSSLINFDKINLIEFNSEFRPVIKSKSQVIYVYVITTFECEDFVLIFKIWSNKFMLSKTILRRVEKKQTTKVFIEVNWCLRDNL